MRPSGPSTSQTITGRTPSAIGAVGLWLANSQIRRTSCALGAGCRARRLDRRRCGRPLWERRDDRYLAMRSSGHRHGRTGPAAGVSQDRASTRSSFRGQAGLPNVHLRRRSRRGASVAQVAKLRARPRECWWSRFCGGALIGDPESSVHLARFVRRRGVESFTRPQEVSNAPQDDDRAGQRG